MSEDKKLQTYVTYDFSKNVTDISCSTAYISGIQNILTDWITQDDKIETIGESFNKFVTISKIDKEIADAGLKTDKEKQEYLKTQDLPVLDKFEGDLYVLWSLLQQMKFKATEQGLDIITESSATTEDIRDLGTALAEGQNINAKLSELKSSMTIIK
jgi:hypothetical protein|tara:strand:- start:1995 stop:2465 length:471 start_codon:yes stop_codon:yes gene_type:complete